jgi:phosphoribosyl-ATP pyrophosphohydrolase
MKNEIDKLYTAVRKSRDSDPRTRATARLLASGRSKIAKKVIEEAAEVSLACVAANRKQVVRETADLFYNVVVLLAAMGLKPKDVWKEMATREATLGIAGKLPKNGRGANGNAAEQTD